MPNNVCLRGTTIGAARPGPIIFRSMINYKNNAFASSRRSLSNKEKTQLWISHADFFPFSEDKDWADGKLFVFRLLDFFVLLNFLP
jgi:hypothetical protein